MIPLIRFANRAVKENNPAAGNKSDIVIGDITKKTQHQESTMSTPSHLNAQPLVWGHGPRTFE
ncbi:hypothetical protein, partial [Acinetobacter baumannii]|uniref:hypothetical protein n=1 Tax=Acinetobacter baumannii TaxID=470 RepID=UPI0033130697